MTQISQIDHGDPSTYAIIGAAMEVHRQLGSGFLESVYHEALAIELADRKVPFRHEVELPVFYKVHRLEARYRADFVCFDSIVVEIKALSRMGGVEYAQLINYLRAIGARIGLLLNFGAGSLEYRRLISSKSASSAKSADGLI